MKRLPIVILITMGFLASSAAFAFFTFQAGHIENGQKVEINGRSGVASYFAEGKEGIFEFVCQLQGNPGEKDSKHHCHGNRLKADLIPGKNFSMDRNSPLTYLHAGLNGPFKWVLTDEDANGGNIKVFYRCGADVTVQCLGARIS